MINLDVLEGKSAAEIMAVLKAERDRENKANEFSSQGISRTQSGELMVTVSSDRWPITLGCDEWATLLGKTALITKALAELGIVQLTKDQRKAIKAAKAN